MLYHSLGLAFASVLTLLPIANPLSTVALFLSLTGKQSESERLQIAKKACINAFCVLSIFFIAGRLIMEFFGISIPGLRIAGGFVVARVALDMMASRPPESEVLAAPEKSKHDDISFVPLAMPSISGPGAIAATIGLTSHVNRWPDYISILIGILSLSLICYFVLASSGKIVKFLSPTRLDAISKIMGFLILCIGVQFILNGMLGILEDPSVVEMLRKLYH